jgi:hypothetical protein
LGSGHNQNGYNKNCEKINWRGTMFIKSSGKTKTEMAGPSREDLKKMKVRNWREKCIDRTSYMRHTHDTSTHLKQTFYPWTQGVSHNTRRLEHITGFVQIYSLFIITTALFGTINKLPKYHI